MNKIGKQLQSGDFEESACEILQASGLNWLLLLGSHENGTTFRSGLGESGAKIIAAWIQDGRLARYLMEHIKMNFPNIDTERQSPEFISDLRGLLNAIESDENNLGNMAKLMLRGFKNLYSEVLAE